VELSRVAESHQQAQQAALVAQTMPSHSPVADWANLGIYRMLLQFPVDHLRATMLHPGVIKLLYADRHRDLIRTLELYFDLGGDAQRTAASLGVHKASLYYRLRKIESRTSGFPITSEPVSSRIARSASWARTLPCGPLLAPISETGFPRSGVRSGGRDIQSIASFRAPGTP